MVRNWEHFNHIELKCRCGCGDNKMEDAFMEKMVLLRKVYGKPLIVNSAYRCSLHNIGITGGASGPHTHGRAIDIGISGADAVNFLECLFLLNSKLKLFTGIGFNQKGIWNTRFIHIDDLAIESRPTIWSY